MVLLNEEQNKGVSRGIRDVEPEKPNCEASSLRRIRLARDLFGGAYRPGQTVKLSEVAAKYMLEAEAVWKLFAELQTLGMVTLGSNRSAMIHSPNPKEMKEAYEIRAALEEIAGRTAAPALQGKVASLQKEVDAMREETWRGQKMCSKRSFRRRASQFRASRVKRSTSPLATLGETTTISCHCRRGVGESQSGTCRGKESARRC